MVDPEEANPAMALHLKFNHLLYVLQIGGAQLLVRGGQAVLNLGLWHKIAYQGG